MYSNTQRQHTTLTTTQHKDVVAYAEAVVALTKRGDWPALPRLLRWAARRVTASAAAAGAFPSPASRLLALAAHLRCSPGRGFIEACILGPLGTASDTGATGLRDVASVLHALATLDIAPPPAQAPALWARVAAAVVAAAVTAVVADLALALWAAVVLGDDGDDGGDAVIEAAAEALLAAVMRDPAALLPAARRQVRRRRRGRCMMVMGNWGYVLLYILILVDTDKLNTQALLALTARRLLLPSPAPPPSSKQQRLHELLSSASGPLGPLPPLPSPSPSKLQASVFAHLTSPTGGGIPLDRVQEEVPPFPTPNPDSTAAAAERQLDWLGYRIDFLVFPREGLGLGPVAVEVDGPHHFLLEEGRCVGGLVVCLLDWVRSVWVGVD